MTERRDALAPEERARCARAVAARLAGLDELGAARVVAGYVARGAELDPAPALEEARRRGGTLAYPRVTEGTPRLTFHRIAAAADLRPGRYGILEPDGACPEVPAEAIDLFVLPGLAFDPDGRRLGYGGGYFDELIAHLRPRGRGYFVGLAYDFQVVDRCPAGEGDHGVDCVVTDARVLRPGGGP